MECSQRKLMWYVIDVEMCVDVCITALYVAYYIFKSYHCANCTVVLWNHLLGGVQWWKNSLPRSRSRLFGRDVGEWIQNGEAKECCLH